MAGAVSVYQTYGTSTVTSTVWGASEASCSCSSSSYLPQVSCPRSPKFARSIKLSSSSTPLSLSRSGLSHFGSWSGRSHLGNVQLLKIITGRQLLSSKGIVGRVQASLLGVGAPEALVIAVVALLVFGPKGLAEVARTLGKSLKAFQPTIQELQQVSREFRSTLEQEIGLDEIRNPSKPVDNSPSPPTAQPSNFVNPPNQTPSKQSSETSESLNGQNAGRKVYSSEDYVQVTAEQAKALVPEDLRREAELAAWGGALPTKSVKEEEEASSSESEAKKSEEKVNENMN
ncbi:hypothetical protein R1sor_026899 [Riccia sorocarpa]|uniref:Sec-independent protein translocase protein TATB, chloroplastic n=1 Tax=Riccia sorocarpa TaxID=122646 RepID=A0ABD3GEE1_9MARC